MIRGTTPTYIFPIPFDSANIEKLRITFEQGSVEITKTEDECTFNNKDEEYTSFFQAMNTLEQIAMLKVLENRVLYIFKDDIDREARCGSISILSAIQNTANAIYFISQSPDAFCGKNTLKQELGRFERKLNGYTTIAEKEKESITDFVSLAMAMYENTVNNMYQSGNSDVDQYCQVMNENLSSLIKNNFEVLDKLNSNIEISQGANSEAYYEDNESMEYVAKPDFVDPSIR